MRRLLSVSLALGVFVLTVPLAAGAQPFPLPQSPGGPTITHDSQGHRFESFAKPGGGSVVYGPGNERYESFPLPGGGDVVYGSHGERYESHPDPAAAPDARRR